MKRRLDLHFHRRAVCQGMLGMATAALWAPAIRADDDTVANTAYGKIRGTRADGIHAFKGVPYGADTSKTRFQKPAPPPPWTGVRDATHYGAQAPQADRPFTSARALLASWGPPQPNSEDCLFLNVWTPGVRDDEKRPVMVWLHGGGFSAGSGSALGYDGTRLAERGDVVVITINHRLNIFGFLYLAEIGGEQYADSGNVSQHDIIAALRWVRDNVEEFGGDPNNVTIFGESGGGMKVCTLMAMPEAQGLFHRAVVQSGPLLRGADPEEATATAHAALDLMNVSPTHLKALNSLPTDRILQTYFNLPQPEALKLAPVVDGRSLPRHPFHPDAPKISAHVPLLIGMTKTETTYLLGNPENFALDWNDVPERLGKYTGSMDAEALVARYRELLPQASPSDVLFAVTTNLMMTLNLIAVADRKTALLAAPVYRYELIWETPVDGGKWQSPHTLDIALMFDNVANSKSILGDAPQAQHMAEKMSEAWLAFARNGNPNNRMLPDWAPYNTTHRPTLMFDAKSFTANNPHQLEVEALGDATWDVTKAVL